MKSIKIYFICILSLVCFLESYCQVTIPAATNKHLRIMSYNAPALRPEKFENVVNIINISNVDILGYQEIDSLFCWNVYPPALIIDVTKELTKRTGMYGYFDAEKYCPHEDKGDGGFGNSVFSKQSALSHSKIILPHFNPTPPRDPNGGVVNILEYKDYIVFNTHYGLAYEKNRRDASNLINELAKGYNKPIFLIGDFNADSNDQPFKILQEEWEILSDPTEITYHGYGQYGPGSPDHIFGYKNKDTNGQARYYYNIIEREVIHDNITSDHYPFIVELTFSNIAPIIYTASSSINTLTTFNQDIVVKSGILSVNSTGEMAMHSSNSIIVESGASLVLNGGRISNANIIVKPGGTLTVNNNGIIKVKNYDDNLQIKKGGLFNFISGEITIN